MKKLLSTALVIILATTMFTACAPSDNGTPDDATITRYTTEGKETKLVPDETATGELTIFKTDVDYGVNTKNAITLAIDKYKELYPNVNVNFKQYKFTTTENYYEDAKKLQTEIMSERGPDIFWAMGNMDVFKMAKSGRIADMTEFFENDKNFNVSDYNETVLYSGQIDGRQYILPTKYNIPVLLTTQKNIDDGMIDADKTGDFFDMTTQISYILDKSKSEGGKPYTLLEVSGLAAYIKTSGLKFVDYSKESVIMDTEEVKRVAILAKGIDAIRTPSYVGMSDVLGAMSNKILSGNAFGQLLTSGVFYETLINASYINSKQKPIILPHMNIRGNITASVVEPVMVNDSCENKQNAYNFLKVLISPEVQGYTDYDLHYNKSRSDMVPISNVALDMLINAIKQEGAFDIAQLGGLSQEFIDSYKKAIKDIDYVSYYLPYDSIVKEELQRYYDDEVDIDSCLQSLQDKLEIYISE